MGIIEYVTWLCVEVPKYILVYHGVMGYEVKSDKRNLLYLLTLLIGPVIVIVMPEKWIYYETFWSLFFLLAVFKGKYGKKL